MSAYLDLLAVTHPRPTQNGQGRRRRRDSSRALLLQVMQAFDIVQAERLSTAALVAFLDDHYPDWYARTSERHVRGQAEKAAVLARRLALHGVPAHRGVYGRREARGFWRSDIERTLKAAL
jgi:hypothetical protein